MASPVLRGAHQRAARLGLVDKIDHDHREHDLGKLKRTRSVDPTLHRDLAYLLWASGPADTPTTGTADNDPSGQSDPRPASP